MSNDYGKRYPGSGGATDRPPTGGAEWCPLPEDTFYVSPVTETIVDRHEPGFLGRILGQKATISKRQVVTGHAIRKNYH